MTPRARDLPGSHGDRLGARAARYAALATFAVLVVLGSYRRLTSAALPDVAVVPNAALASSLEGPACETTREAPKLSDEGDGASPGYSTCRPEADDSPARPRPRGGTSAGEACVAAGTPPRNGARDGVTRSSGLLAMRAESPARRRARLMVFLN